MSKKEYLKRELIELTKIVLYLACSFSLLATIKSLALIQHGINDFAHGYQVALVESLILGKVVLLCQRMPLLKKLERKRSIALSVLYKSLVLMTVVDVGSKIEHVVFHRNPAEVAVHPILFICAHQMVMLIIFFVLFLFRELDDAMGPGVLRNLIFGARQASATVSNAVETTAA